MNIKINLSFLIFLMLMLTQAALSVPVDNTNTQLDDDAKPKTDDVPPQETNKDEPANSGNLSQLSPLEDLKKISELVKNTVKEDLSDAEAKVDRVLAELNPMENVNKMKELLVNLSVQQDNIKQSIKNSTELLQNAFKQQLDDMQAKATGILNKITPSF